MANVINWFEIPAIDIKRAVDFYSCVLSKEMQITDMMDMEMAFFNNSNQGIGGAVVSGLGRVPSNYGVRIFLNGGDDLSVPLSRVEKAGGKITMEKTKINDQIGFIAQFIDTEGNNIALHSQR